MTAYYNEIDPYAAQWLRNLIKAGHIAPGDVDERSIVDVRADDLRGYAQCHFFAGIGGWSVALRLAGWPDERPIWTGSCPCQPFSAAGKGKAGDDERHLWPAWFPLIAKCHPPIVFGEQVEAAVGWGWVDAVFSDLEGEGYTCGTTVLPACGVGAPHIRQRLWFVADSTESGRQSRRRAGEAGNGGDAPRLEPGRLRDDGGLADASSGRHEQIAGGVPEISRKSPALGRDDIQPECGITASGMADANGGDTGTERLQRGGEYGQRTQNGSPNELGNTAGEQVGIPGRPWQPGTTLNGFWRDAEWIACTDGKSRPVGPGSFPLGHGIQRRASKLRAYGNAIVPQVAAEFIMAARGDH